MQKLLESHLNKPVNTVYFIGIGGTSMSGLARLTSIEGLNVLGSDMVESDYVRKLKEAGIKINIGHNADNIDENIDLIVYSAAIHEDNPERQRAKELSIPEIERSDYLGLISSNYNEIIGVSGTHGKTTTSSMIALLLKSAGLDPSVSIGGRLDEIGGNARLGHNKDFFVVESCEFVDSFLKTNHTIGIITNIEEDHLDYFKEGLPAIKKSFRKFAEILPETGLLVAWGDSEDVRSVVKGLSVKTIFYGLGDDNDWNVRNISYNQIGNPDFDIYKNGKFFDHFSIQIPGEHNVLNALASIIVADYLNIDKNIIRSGLAAFEGAHRRFEFDGRVNGINVYEDYAHHPTELKVVIDSALNHKHKDLWVIFQPHTYSRTYLLFDKFVQAFEKADKIILNDIYSDRETNEKFHIYSEDLAKEIEKQYHKKVEVISDFDDIVSFVTEHTTPGDLVLVAGSQTINQVAPKLIHSLENFYNEKAEKTIEE